MLARYLRLLGVQLRASALLSLQYRADFALQSVMSVFWTGTALVPMLVLYGVRRGVAGWSWTEAMLVVGFFTVLKGFLNGAIQPGLVDVVEHIRKGTLDFLLLKPADAQFLVSTSRFELTRFADVLGGVAILAWASRRLPHPSLAGVLLALGLLVGALAILDAIWISVVSLAFYVVKIDNLSYLFVSIYDAARWPSSVFRGVFSVVFTFVIPLALMTTYPALALLGRIGPAQVLGALVGAVACTLAGRVIWTRALRRYTSAGG